VRNKRIRNLLSFTLKVCLWQSVDIYQYMIASRSLPKAQRTVAFTHTCQFQSGLKNIPTHGIRRIGRIPLFDLAVYEPCTATMRPRGPVIASNRLAPLTVLASFLVACNRFGYHSHQFRTLVVYLDIPHSKFRPEKRHWQHQLTTLTTLFKDVILGISRYNQRLVKCNHSIRFFCKVVSECVMPTLHAVLQLPTKWFLIPDSRNTYTLIDSPLLPTLLLGIKRPLRP